MNKPLAKAPVSYRIDLRWCLDELQKDGRLSQRDANLVATTPRPRDQLNWHPLQVIAHFDFVDAQGDGKTLLTVDMLTDWLAGKAGQPVFHIDPLKIRAGEITPVMSYKFADRHGILAVRVTPDDITVASAQPFHSDWVADLTQTLRNKSIRRVVANPADIHRYTIEFYKLRAPSRAPAPPTPSPASTSAISSSCSSSATPAPRPTPTTSTSSTSSTGSCSTPSTSAPPTFTWSRAATSAACASASTACCTTSTSSRTSS